MDTQVVKSFLQAANLSDIDIEALLGKKASNITYPSVDKKAIILRKGDRFFVYCKIDFAQSK